MCLIVISSIPHCGDLGLQNKILSFELPVFFYQSIKLLAVIAWAWAAAIGVVIFAMVEALAACGSGGSGQITRVLEPVISREECIYIGKTYTGAIVAVRRSAVRKSRLLSSLLWGDCEGYKWSEEIRTAVTPTIVVGLLKSII